ncbi:YeiH family protein [Phaeacidiphilus oryzae]|uniref:YeiH family protein n=1 Tax=Phaeacidiphilus oryzae TaxID=348818 RepID=UPI002244FAE1|nr:putative sulfate exporter family transporter [Phaeacidiphilus oryzae]
MSSEVGSSSSRVHREARSRSRSQSQPRSRPAWPVRRWEGVRRRAPGLALAVAVAVAATLVGRLAPTVGAPVTAIVIGAVIAALAKPGERLKPGIATAAKPVLQVAVVALGAQLSLLQVVRVGAGSLPVMLGTLAVCLGAAALVGRRMGVPSDLRTLVGVGTGICGASAIAAAAPVIAAAEVDIAYAVSTIFVFNVAAVLIFPTLGHLLGMSQQAFGLFAGTAVNDMSSVVAAASVYGHAAANHAVVVKLTRTLLIIPICLGLAALTARRARGAEAREGAGAGAREGRGPERGRRTGRARAGCGRSGWSPGSWSASCCWPGSTPRAASRRPPMGR